MSVAAFAGVLRRAGPAEGVQFCARASDSNAIGALLWSCGAAQGLAVERRRYYTLRLRIIMAIQISSAISPEGGKRPRETSLPEREGMRARHTRTLFNASRRLESPSGERDDARNWLRALLAIGRQSVVRDGARAAGVYASRPRRD